MSEYMLHILGPSRHDDIAAIVGDLSALRALHDAISDAIQSGSGGVFLAQSDGEGYALAVVRVADMSPMCTAYAAEIDPVRSLRETVHLTTLPRFREALHKSSQATRIENNSGTHTSH